MNMNQSTFNKVTEYKSGGHSWAEMAVMFEYPNGEALRSAYRRFNRRNESTNTLQGVIDAMQGIKDSMANMFGSSVEYVKEDTPSFPPSIPIPFDAPLQLDLVSTLIIADLHCPYHDVSALERAVTTRPAQIVIAGDLFDFASVSRHGKAEQQSRLESDLETAGLVLLELAKVAPVYVVSGNHDERLISKLDTALRFSRIVAMALNGRTPENSITVSDYDYCFIGDSYVIGHLSQYSKEPGKVAAQIAAKYNRNCLVGHDHIIGAQTANGKPNGKLIGASIGSMTDHTKHWYAQRRLNTFPEWKTGYALIDAYGMTLYDGSGNVYFQQVIDDSGHVNLYSGQ